MEGFVRVDIDPLVIGGADHRTYVAFYLTLLVLLLSARDLLRRHDELVRRVAAAVSIAQQVAMYGFHLYKGDRWADALPLHICRLCTLLGLVWLLGEGEQDLAMQLVFSWGLFAYGSLAYPYGIEPRDHLMGWSFVVNHSLTLLLPVYAAVVAGWRPTVRGLAASYVGFLGFLAVAESTNRLTGGNYFYLVDRPVLQGMPHRRFLHVAAVGTLGVFTVGYAASRLVARLARGDRGPAASDVLTARPPY